MPTTDKKKKIISIVKKRSVVNTTVGNYEKHPFFVKKANEAKDLLKGVELPKKTTKS